MNAARLVEPRWSRGRRTRRAAPQYGRLQSSVLPTWPPSAVRLLLVRRVSPSAPPFAMALQCAFLPLGSARRGDTAPPRTLRGVSRFSHCCEVAPTEKTFCSTRVAAATAIARYCIPAVAARRRLEGKIIWVMHCAPPFARLTQRRNRPTRSSFFRFQFSSVVVLGVTFVQHRTSNSALCVC